MMDAEPILEKIRLVLVEPRGAFNIGSVVRVMKNTGFKDLALVNPADFHNDDAYRACVGARDLLDSASVYSSLQDAVRDTNIVAATTRRGGKRRKITCSLEELHEKIFPALRAGKAAIIFGREECGLSNRETDLCNVLVSIPANPRFPSFNLSHAAALVCYRLFLASMTVEALENPNASEKTVAPQMTPKLKPQAALKVLPGAASGTAPGAAPKVQQPVVNAALEELLDYIRFAFTDIGFFTKGTPSYVIPLFRRIFGRALIDDEELKELTHIFHRLYGLFQEKKRPAAK